MTIADAINESVCRDRIVTIPFTAADAKLLSRKCDDSVDCGHIQEFWGRDEDGDEWRVHLEVSS